MDAVTWSAVVEYNYIIFDDPCALSISGIQVVVERCNRLEEIQLVEKGDDDGDVATGS